MGCFCQSLGYYYCLHLSCAGLLLFQWGLSLSPAPDRYISSGSSVTWKTAEGAVALWGQWGIPVLVLWEGRGQRTCYCIWICLHLWKVVLVPVVLQRVCCNVDNAVCVWVYVCFRCMCIFVSLTQYSTSSSLIDCLNK